MAVQNLWPLSFIILIPIIVLLYFLKQRATEKQVSSLLLWQEVYKNLEARTPFEKLKQNLLMYLQILLMFLLILALMAPVIKRGGRVTQNVVLVMDVSASMGFAYGDADRLQAGIGEAKELVDSLDSNDVITLITCGNEASVIYQGTDAFTVKNRLEQLSVTNEEGTLELAGSVVNAVIAEMDNVQVVCYTDSEFDSKSLVKSNDKAGYQVVNLYSEGENCSVDYLNYTVTDDATESLCKVTNRGNTDISQDVVLYANGEVIDIQSCQVAAGESETIYFTPVEIPDDGSVILSAELSQKDALQGDNICKAVVSAQGEKKVLLLSEGNVFLEKAFGVNENVSVYKAKDVNVISKEEPYDLYVFDGIQAEEVTGEKSSLYENIPKEAALLFTNYEENQGEYASFSGQSQITNEVLSFAKSDVTQYVEGYSFGITHSYCYQLPEWGIPVIKDGQGNVAGFVGSMTTDQDTHLVGVLGFDIHNSNLALQTEFPIFMSQLGEYLLGGQGNLLTVTNFPVEQESQVIPVAQLSKEEQETSIRTGGQNIRNYILILVLLLLLVEWFIYVRQVHSKKKKQFLVVRGLLMLVIVLSMVGLAIPVNKHKSEAIFLLDVSDSMKGNMEEMEGYVRSQLQNMPDQYLGGVVLFGKDVAVDQFLSEQNVFSEVSAEVVSTATNIEKAVLAASSMFDDGVNKQLILVTDGSENEGSMSMAATSLKGNEVSLSVLSMEDSISQGPEVYVDDLNVPSVIHEGDRYQVTVRVKSNVETDAKLTLYAGRTTKGQQDVHLTKGSNQFVFEDVGEKGTLAQYKVVIEAAEDTISVNNTYATFAQIESRPKVLLIEGKTGESLEFQKILQQVNVEYDVMLPSTVPNKVAELNQYKAVITLDVHFDDLRKGFDQALESYVKQYAGGYLCIGGENSYALGGYKNTALEEILPVNMELQGENEIPKMSMYMVIDQSGSMCASAADNVSVTGLDLAKQAAMAGVEELRDTDEVGVLAFDDKYQWIVSPQTVGDSDSVTEKIEHIAYGGGTSIYPALEQAYKKALESDAKIKHIILLTDGQDGYREYDTLIDQMNEAGITLSTVAVGYGADVGLLSGLAQSCGGRDYYTDIDNSIPRIFAQEVYLSTDTYLVNQQFYPVITSSSQVLQNVFDEGSPAIYGYVATTIKQTADLLLMTERQEPLLATWQCGLGRTVAWTSDGTNEWTSECASWENYPMLWSNLLNYIMAETDLGEDSLSITKNGNYAKVWYQTPEYNGKTKVTALVTDEDGEEQEIVLDAIRPGEYSAELDLKKVGVYSFNVRKQEGNTILASYNAAYANQYSAEYQFSNSKTDLTTFANQAGGRLVSAEDDIWKIEEKKVTARMSLTIPLLILALFLLLLDIIVRRLSLDIFGGIKHVWETLVGKIHRMHRGVRQNTSDAQEAEKQKEPAKDSVAEEKNAKENDGKKSIPQEERKKNKIQKKQKGGKETSGSDRDLLDMNQLLAKKRERSDD